MLDKIHDHPFYFKKVILWLFFHNSYGQNNSPTVDFLWEKTEGNLRWINTELSIYFRKANLELSLNFRRATTEPSMHLRKANTEPSMHFRRANREPSMHFRKANTGLI